MKHINLTVLSPKAVSCQVEGIASCPWPSAVALTLPLNAAECPKLSFAALAEDQVVFQDGIQLPCRPLEAALGGYAQLMPMFIADPTLSKLPISKSTSGESGRICVADTQATLVQAAYHLHTRRLVAWEGHPGGRA